MSSRPLLALIARCRALGRPRSQAPDADLLLRFVRRRDASAFEELLERYAPLVWSVCRRIGPAEADAEDAFQATFLALVRQASRLDGRQPLGGWLHTVAVRVARKARTQQQRQQTRLALLERTTPGDVADDVSSRELIQAVDEEIERLPATVRAPLILCCLEGRTRDEAAVVLGCTVAAVKGRLERGRELLRWRHSDFVHALAYSPDGKKIVTTGVGRALVLWDAATGKELRVFSYRSQPREVAFSPDGKLVATSLRWGQLWDAATGKMVRELKNRQTWVNTLTFAPDSKTLATADGDGSVRLWDPANGEEKRRLDCGQGEVRAVAYSSDGSTLASGSSDGTIRLWDAANGKERRRISANKKGIRSIACSPEGKQLAIGSDEESLCFWDMATGRQIRALGDKQVQFCPVAFSPDGKWLAAGYGDGAFRLWDAASGEEKRHWHAGIGRARSVAFSPDGKTLATAVLWDGCVRLWDVETGSERSALDGHHGPIPLLRFAADKKSLISGGFDRNLLWWNLATQTPLRRFTWTTKMFNAFALSFALSPDGKSLAAADHNTHEVWLWDISTGKSTKLPGKHGNWIQAVVFSPDGRLVASGGRDGTIHLWDARQVKELRQIKASGAQTITMYLLFSPDGKTLASGSMTLGSQWTTRFWDVASGKERRVFASPLTSETPSAFSPDGKVLACANDPELRQEAFVRLFDMTTGKELCRHGGHHGGSGPVAFSPDGKLVVSGEIRDGNDSIHVWEAATGRLIRRFEGHHSWVMAVTFASDGLTVASSAGDSTILLWDITGRQRDGKLPHAALTPRQLESCWRDLANEDAAKAYDAVWTLAAAPEQAVPFLAKQLPPVPRPDAKTVARLIADLDNDDFDVRQNAAEELKKRGDTVAFDLRKALDGKPSLEVRRRLQQLLDQSRDWTSERLRDHRAIQALEHIGTRQAKVVLQQLTAGTPEAFRTEEAKAALGRSVK